jgi:hypothetical protein
MTKKNISMIAAAVAIAAVAGGTVATGYGSKVWASASNRSNTAAVLATVNGRAISDAEVMPLQQSGLERTTALDRRITQNVVADAAEKEFSHEAAAMLEASRADILAQLYLKKRSDALKAEIKDAEIAEFYAKNVKDEDFRNVRMKALLSSDAKEAQTAYETLSKSKTSKEAVDLIGKMTYLNKEGDHLMPLRDIPYNLGQVVKKMRAGDVLQPVVIREGVLVVFLEDTKDMPKPTLEKSKEEIRNFLIGEHISKEVQALRKAAKIELKG